MSAYHVIDYYVQNGEALERHDAIMLSWLQVWDILGESFQGESHQSERLINWLLAQGAPAWVRDAEGFVDEYGWGLIGPLDLSERGD